MTSHMTRDVPVYPGPMCGMRVFGLGVWVAEPFAASLLTNFGAGERFPIRGGLVESYTYQEKLNAINNLDPEVSLVL
jgi:hypothetical protein